MPELPEVEVLVRHLAPQLRGRRVRDVRVTGKRVVRPGSAEELKRELRGVRFIEVHRRAKYILLNYQHRAGEPVRTLLGHLGMTGRMFLQPVRAPLPMHVALAIDLGAECLVFDDPRGFGRVSLQLDALDDLGPEPLNESFTPEALRDALRRSRQPVKVKLLDQTVVAGVGNIYASEALHRARISPRRRAARLSFAEAGRLHRAIRDVLKEAISLGSSLPLEAGDGLFYFGRTADAPASAAERFRVYDRAGQPCGVCATPIRRLIQAGRSTFFCPVCQR